MTKKEIQATMPTISDRPDHYYRLINKLILDGFVFQHNTAEWVKAPSNPWEKVIERGRICWDDRKAWLRHPWTNAETHITE
jgi:hypothetical protein